MLSGRFALLGGALAPASGQFDYGPKRFHTCL